GSKNFTRLKIGVAPEKRSKNFNAANFVLKKFAKAEEKILAQTIKKATEAVAIILAEGTDTAMNQFN
ncbi:aminoacyl-tRNA hydrolase, partial [Patescibacteria group bacterium]|nr:aminoacyl-tRNA hydrolase [Patescibacteria group bacterium]